MKHRIKRIDLYLDDGTMQTIEIPDYVSKVEFDMAVEK